MVDLVTRGSREDWRGLRENELIFSSISSWSLVTKSVLNKENFPWVEAANPIIKNDTVFILQMIQQAVIIISLKIEPKFSLAAITMSKGCTWVSQWMLLDMEIHGVVFFFNLQMPSPKPPWDVLEEIRRKMIMLLN
jgi:hypothetical protein